MPTAGNPARDPAWADALFSDLRGRVSGLSAVPERVAAVGQDVIARMSGPDFLRMDDAIEAIQLVVSPRTAWKRREPLGGQLRCGCRDDPPAVIPQTELKWLQEWGYGRERSRRLLVGQCGTCRSIFFDASN